ncbi:DUF1707 domain-containing protein [Haloechinothrix sp. YIM 98757]|uniref:DUF1707 domain-containing protein n=1 Tax=Haloechinothrix aidingensis TaxID=2752311 RepID=A0A838A6Z7_9PSEU|nr:DUF1707 domain-containing protein [Haloechinothrix aidingensis]
MGTVNGTDTPSTDGSVPARELRVSDAERDYVVGLLQKATGKGLINLDDFSERADNAYAARTRAELNTVLIDLPGLMHRESPPAGVSGTPAGTAVPDRRLELTAHYSSLTRNGRWYVPERLLVRNRYGSTKLDFTEARIDGSVVQVELDIKWGSVLIIIPTEAAADVDAITEIKYGSLEDKTRSTGTAGTPRIMLSGRVHGGSLAIRHPKRGWWR